MSDKVKALIAQAREREHEWSSREQMPSDVILVARLADALEASVQAPAVDREALTNVLGVALANAYDDDSVVTVEESVAAQLVASGVLLDDAEVEARGARAGYDAGYTNGGYDQADRAAGISPSRIDFDAGLVADARAQQVREGK